MRQAAARVLKPTSLAQPRLRKRVDSPSSIGIAAKREPCPTRIALQRAVLRYKRANPPGAFQKLLSPASWRALPQQVRKRFATEPGEQKPKLYAGRVIETRLSFAGRLLARLAGIIGTPLPETNGATGPASVSVTNNAKMRGQIWTRVYGRAGQFPQVVHSVKRFQGPTGLEEFVGPGTTWGIGMTLRLSAENSALVFRSERYFIQLGRCRMVLPKWLSPGNMAITHRQIKDSDFQFLLELDHPLVGQLIRQDCIFSDTNIKEA